MLPAVFLISHSAFVIHFFVCVFLMCISISLSCILYSAFFLYYFQFTLYLLTFYPIFENPFHFSLLIFACKNSNLPNFSKVPLHFSREQTSLFSTSAWFSDGSSTQSLFLFVTVWQSHGKGVYKSWPPVLSFRPQPESTATSIAVHGLQTETFARMFRQTQGGLSDMMNNMKYNIYETAVAIDDDRKMEIRDMFDIVGALLFMMCAMAITIALLWFLTPISTKRGFLWTRIRILR